MIKKIIVILHDNLASDEGGLVQQCIKRIKTHLILNVSSNSLNETHE